MLCTMPRSVLPYPFRVRGPVLFIVFRAFFGSSFAVLTLVLPNSGVFSPLSGAFANFIPVASRPFTGTTPIRFCLFWR